MPAWTWPLSTSSWGDFWSGRMAGANKTFRRSSNRSMSTTTFPNRWARTSCGNSTTGSAKKTDHLPLRMFLFKQCIKGNSLLFWGHSAAHRERISLAQGSKNTFFVFFIGTVMVKLTLAVAKIPKQSRTFFQDFHPWKGTFGCRNWIEMTFFGYLTKNVALKVIYFSPFRFVTEKAHVDPKQHFFGMGWTWVVGSTWHFSEAKHNSHKLRKFKATLFCWVSRWHCFRFFGQAGPEARLKSPFFRCRNSGRWHVTFF